MDLCERILYEIKWIPDLNKLNNLLNKFFANQKRMQGINIEKWFECTFGEKERERERDWSGAELMEPMNFTNHLPKGQKVHSKKGFSKFGVGFEMKKDQRLMRSILL